MLDEITRPGIVARKIGSNQRKAGSVGVEVKLTSDELTLLILCPHSVLIMTVRSEMDA